MRRQLKPTLICALIVLAVAMAFFAAGCGTAAQNASQAGPASSTAEGILAQVATASQSLTGGTGQFNLSVSVTGDATKMPAAASALLGQPVTVAGTFAFSENPQAADVSLTASIAGQNFPLGIKAVDKKAWIQFVGQWYEAPADAAQTAATATTLSAADQTVVVAAVKAAAVDPLAWMTGLKIVGNDTIDGSAAYHIQGAVDVTKVMADVTKLMADKTIQGMMGSLSGAMKGSTGTTAAGATKTSVSLPSAAELQTALPQMLKNLTVDMWVTKDTYQMRQVQIDATIVPPADQNAQGISSIALKLTLSMAPATAPLTVTAPADVKPFADLQTAVKGLTSMFSGLLGAGDTDTTVSTAR